MNRQLKQWADQLHDLDPLVALRAALHLILEADYEDDGGAAEILMDEEAQGNGRLIERARATLAGMMADLAEEVDGE